MSASNADFQSLTPTIEIDVVTVRNGVCEQTVQQIVSEIPLTIVVNNLEIATLACSPIDLKELTLGFLRTSLFIHTATEVEAWTLDAERWTVTIRTTIEPDRAVLEKRLYTSGCGKGVIFANLAEVLVQRPLTSSLTLTWDQIVTLAAWLQGCSGLHRLTGGVHSAGLSFAGNIPGRFFDDIGRHNAVDKAIGAGLVAEVDFSQSVIVCSGRISSEILHKVKSCNIPIIMARGAPTHQAILRARQLGITAIGLARGERFIIYSHPERVQQPEKSSAESG